MKSNWKTLLSCLALTFTMGVFAACATTDNSSSNQPSTPQQSSPADPDTPDTPDVPDTPDTPDVPATYTVKFVDEDGTELSSATYEEGATVVEPQAPTKAADNTYTYAFAGWDKEVTAANADVTYTATYTPTYIEYVISFVDEDGNEIATANYHYGDEVEVPTATKAADNTYTYEFDSWDKEIVAVTENATYTASFTPVYIEYAITFVNDDGSEISTANYHYGDAVVLPETTPTKKATEVYSYAFAAWDKEVVTVAGAATYTATYTATLNNGLTAYNTSAAQGESVVLGAGVIGAGANYAQGQQVGGSIDQAYLAFDGNYSFGDYIALDFTGKNMPEIAFFAENYNSSMYAEEKTKQGVVVASGITMYNGEVNTDANLLNGSKQVKIVSPYMITHTEHGWMTSNSVSDSKLARANLADDTQYRVIMGFESGSSKGSNGITLHWALYNAETKEVLETAYIETWGFFNGGTHTDSGTGAVNVSGMTLSDLVGSIVLYGKFGTTCTIDKIHGIFEDSSIEAIANGLNNNATSTVTFKDADGNELKKIENVPFGATVSYDEALPTPEVTEDKYYNYSYAWDKAFGKITADTVYTLKVVGTVKDGYTFNGVTVNGDSVVLASGAIGNGGTYIGPNENDLINQSYFAIDGDYGLGNYVVLDFTGKNMPEIAFFAKNYNNSMYKQYGDKQGILVASGITQYNGAISNADVLNGGKRVNITWPYMADDVNQTNFTENSVNDSALGRANLVDGTHYRVIMGFKKGSNHNANAGITLQWVLYNVDTNEIVEESSIGTYGFFSGSNAQVGNMTTDDLKGSIVLYGKFGTTCTIDKLHGVVSDTYDNVKAAYAKAL